MGNLAHGSLRHGISRDSILSGQRRSAPNVHERIGARTLQPVAGMGQFLNALRQHVHAAVGMFPWIDEAGGIEIADCAANLIELQQARARRDQQADSQLDGRHIFGQILVGYERQQLAISTKRGPRRKRHKGGLQDQTHVAEKRHDGEKIRARMALCQKRENGVIDGLDGAGNKKTPGITQFAQRFSTAQQMLDFDRDVITKLRKFPVHGLHDCECVRGTVEEIGITEGDVLGARIDLLADIFEQLGYSAESATWRNAYLFGAQELRQGMPKAPPRPPMPRETLAALRTEQLWDVLGVRLNGPKAEGKHIVLNWRFTDTNEGFVLTLENCALTYVAGAQAAAADASFTLPRGTLDEVIAKQTSFPEAVASGKIKFTGNAMRLAELMALMDEFPRMFEIVEPKRTPVS